jgi:mannosyl-3-phosphoglycerate phosphatase
MEKTSFMGESVNAKFSGNKFLIVFSDLDGTLLDHNTYGWQEAQPALNLCKKHHVPIVLVSSKTRAEMEFLRGKLSISAPFVSENGGGIFFQSDNFTQPPTGASFDKGLWKWSLGLSYAHLVRGLQEIRDELRWDIKGFSDMGIEEISQLTGLDPKTSRLAAMREFDEPFIVLKKQAIDENTLHKAANKRGLTVTSGGRFYHLQGKNDKGKAMEKIISWYRHEHKKVFSIGLGDSPNDFPMLELADVPVLIRSQREFPKLKGEIPRLRVTREIGPKGWNKAILDILGKKEEERNV